MEGAARVLGGVVAVSADIRIEEASKAEIEEVLMNSEKLKDVFLNAAKSKGTYEA